MRTLEASRFNPLEWYENIVKISKLELSQKYQELVKLHNKTLDNYINDLNQMTEVDAEELGFDGRKRKIVIAHIMGWEEFQIQVFTDSNPIERMELQIQFKSYVDPDTNDMINFDDPQGDRSKSVDAFNQYQADKYSSWAWDDIKQRAIDTAKKLKDCFPDESSEELLQFLENTPPKEWKIHDGLATTIPSAYYLWMVSLKHEAVEHRQDLVILK